MKNELAGLTTAKVNDAFRKYFNKMSWVYMGNPAQVNSTLFTGTKPLPPSKVTAPVKKN